MSWWPMVERLLRFLQAYTIPSGGQGPSTTKLVWLTAGLASVYSATVGTLAGVSVYIFLGRSDATYWVFIGSLWTAALGFAQSVQKSQHRAATEIALNQPQSATEKP